MIIGKISKTFIATQTVQQNNILEGIALMDSLDTERNTELYKRNDFENQSIVKDAIKTGVVEYNCILNAYILSRNSSNHTTLAFVNGAWKQWVELIIQKNNNAV